jgi:MHS family alpha-ketoglutarate permease-like MFS transporter
VKAELFPADVRALAVRQPQALTVSIFGGTAELVALAFNKSGHEAWHSSDVFTSIAISPLLTLAMSETADRFSPAHPSPE